MSDSNSASSIKKISFQEDEIPLIKNQEEIITHRVSKEFPLYQLGDEVLSPWGDLYLVVDRIEISSSEESPYSQFLTPSQKSEIDSNGPIAILTLRKVEFNPIVEVQESVTVQKYEPPYPLKVIRKVYGQDVYDRLKDDPVHSWRAETGIELIHKEPTKDEFERIVANWNLMTPEQKAKSDEKSEELFGNSNQNRIDLLRREYDFSVGDRVKVRHGIRCRQAGHSGKIVRIDPPDKYGWSSFIVQFDDPSLGSMGFNSGDLEKTEVDESVVFETVQGFEKFSEDELKRLIVDGIRERMAENDVSDSEAEIVDLAIIGSRTKNKAKSDSDLDVVVEYSGRLREDDFFEILHSETEDGGAFEINGIAVDVNPIRKEESGTLADFLKKSDEYWSKKMVSESILDEAGLIVNKKDGAYPKSGNVHIMAGGSGSGKSFILDKLLLFDGKVFNPDITLEMLIEYGKRKPDSKLSKDFYADAGKALSEIDLKRSEDANLVYDFIAKYRLHCEKEAVFFKAISAAKVKPNVVFDVVLKNLQTVEWIAKYAEMGGYDPKNVNLVWVLNDVKVALGQNATRSRTVDSEFLKKAHVGVAKTMADLIEASDKWQKTIDGDVWIVFNKRGVDVKTTTTLNRVSDKDRSYRANTVVDDYVAFHLKERGKPMKQMSEIDKPIMNKILSYIPDEAKRDWMKKN